MTNDFAVLFCLLTGCFTIVIFSLKKRKTIFSASTIAGVVFGLETTLWMVIERKYDEPISWLTIIVILGFLLLLSIGETIGDCLGRKREYGVFKNSRNENSKTSLLSDTPRRLRRIETKYTIVIAFLAILICDLFLHAYEDYQILVTYNHGSFPKITEAYSMLRKALNGEYKFSFITARIHEISFAASTYFAVVLVSNFARKRTKPKDFLLLVGILLYFFKAKSAYAGC